MCWLIRTPLAALPAASVCPLLFLMSRIQGCPVSLCPECRGRDKGIVNRALSFKCSDLAKFFFKFLSLTWHSHLSALVWAVSSILQSLPYPPRSCFTIPSQVKAFLQAKWTLPCFSYVSAVISMQCWELLERLDRVSFLFVYIVHTRRAHNWHINISNQWIKGASIGLISASSFLLFSGHSNPRIVLIDDYFGPYYTLTVYFYFLPATPGDSDLIGLHTCLTEWIVYI